jgi:hypothetical protein
MKKYATQTYLKEIEVSELDLENAEEIFGKDIFDDDNSYEYIYKKLNKDYGWQGESQEIKIETLEKVIAKLKQKGANYLEIVPHGDHHSYILYGIEIRESTKEEIEDHESKRKQRTELKKEYERLMKQVDEVKRKYDKL